MTSGEAPCRTAAAQRVRAVRYFAREAGARQFLDIGTGIPTAGNTHQVAQAIAPGSLVVYVDYDPVVLAHARALLTSKDGLDDMQAERMRMRFTSRDREQVARFFEGTELVEPGLVRVEEWRPDPLAAARAARPCGAEWAARSKRLAGPAICEDQRVRTPLPPVAAVIGFIDAINRGDADRLAALMSPGHLVDRGEDVLVLGSTTGSHLGLPDQEERQLKVIWRATVQDGLLTLWQIIEDTPGQRALLGLSDV